MSDNPRGHANEKGFWEGGESGHSGNKESSGRPSGLPGTRKPKQLGVRVDLEYPEESRREEPRD